jgi:hypothetical protein
MARNVDVKINLVQLILIIIAIITLFGSGFKLHADKVDKINDELAKEVKIKEALLDSVDYYQNKKDQWVAEKRTLQVEIKDIKQLLNDTVVNLTENQKDLLNIITNQKKEKDIISAALIELQVELDSIVHAGTTIVDTTKNTIKFGDTYVNDTKKFNYGLTVYNVVPFPKKTTPELTFDSMLFPNKQLVEFHWEKDERIGYPVSFSVTNSNGFFETTNIDSYAIPNLKKEDLNPNFFQQVGQFFENNRQTVIGVAVGTIVGGTLIWYVTK